MRGGIYLWQQNNKNDDIFYEDLCNKYFERIYFYCKRLVKGQKQFLDFAEECTQNTFLEAQKQISKLKTHPNVKGWLYTTARNLINNSYRSMYIKKKHEVIFDDNIPDVSTELDNELEELFNSTIDLDKLCIEILHKLNTDEYNLYAERLRLLQKQNVSLRSFYKI